MRRGAMWLKDHSSYAGDDCLKWPFAYNGKGYGVTAWDGTTMGAHRAMSIIVNGPPPFVGAEATHLCGHGADGCVNPRHLRWETNSGNQWDRLDHGTDNRGERNGTHKLKAAGVSDINVRLAAGELHSTIAAEYGVHPNTITDIAHGRTWFWLTGRTHPDNPKRNPVANDNQTQAGEKAA